jgi:hypothetical protein
MDSFSSVILLFLLSFTALAILLGLVVGVVFIMRGFGRQSHLNELAARYPVERRRIKKNPSFLWHTAQIGKVQWRRCLDIGVYAEGLYIEVKQLFNRPPPFLIPWQELHFQEETRLYWRPAVLLKIGDPPLTTLTLFREVYEEVKPHLVEIETVVGG